MVDLYKEITLRTCLLFLIENKKAIQLKANLPHSKVNKFKQVWWGGGLVYVGRRDPYVQVPMWVRRPGPGGIPI